MEHFSAVKTEFGKFGDLLDNVKNKLDQASNNIETAARKSRTIERRLKGVQQLPAADAEQLLRLEQPNGGVEIDLSL